MTENALELVATPMAPANLFGAKGPQELIDQASLTAQALANVIRVKKLFKNIGDKSYVFVEGWTLLGSMVGVFPVCVWTRPLEGGGWEARVEARTLSGQVVGAAESQCIRAEALWSFEPVDKWGKKLKPRDDFALRSMAQTRATSKALRQPLGFIVVLAGYNATPAEEMLSEDLTEPLKASIAMVRAKKAAANRPTPVAAAETAPAAAEFTAPPLCPACKSPVGQFASESKAHKGRKYWQCQRANDRVLELEERGDLTWKQIYADAGVIGHWRSWAEEWPRKETKDGGEPRDGRN